MKNHNDKKTHISDYSQVYDSSVDYKKFDFVYNTDDGLYYYAKNDVSSSFIDVLYTSSNRFTLDPEGPLFEGRKSFYIFDSYNRGLELYAGQNINISGSIAGNDGQYKIIEIQESFSEDAGISAYSVEHILQLTPTNSGDWYQSSWFLFIDKYLKWIGVGTHIYNSKLGWIHLDIFNADLQSLGLWFNIRTINEVWFWSSPSLQFSDSAIVYFKQSDPIVFTGFGLSSEKLLNSKKNVISSENGEFCFLYSHYVSGGFVHEKIEPFTLQNEVWVEDSNSSEVNIGQANTSVRIKKFSYDLQEVIVFETEQEKIDGITMGEAKIYSTVDGSLIQSLTQCSARINVEFDRIGETVVISDTFLKTEQIKIFEFSDGSWSKVRSITYSEPEWAWYISLSGDGKTLCVGSALAGSSYKGVYVFKKNGEKWIREVLYSDLEILEVEEGVEFEGMDGYGLSCGANFANQLRAKYGEDYEINAESFRQFSSICYEAWEEDLILTSKSNTIIPAIKTFNNRGHEYNPDYIKISENGRFLFVYMKSDREIKIHIKKNKEWIVAQVINLDEQAGVNYSSTDGFTQFTSIITSFDEKTILINEQVYVYDNSQWRLSSSKMNSGLISSSADKNLDQFLVIEENDSQYTLASYKNSTFSSYRFDKEEGWLYWRNSSDKKSLEIYSFDQKAWWRCEYSSVGATLSKMINDEEIDVSQIPQTSPEVSDVDRNLSTRIWVQPLSENGDSFENYEDASSHEISISSRSSPPSLNQDDWTTDQFFFDADYGSTVNFKAENKKMEFGNGYYKISPMSINSLKCEIDLQFKNRTNREANAIIHFVENHLGQLEKDKSNNFLKYSQGISGFRWDGDSSFHPYDNVDNQTKTFYCTNFNHSLNFEDSNNVSLTLKNLNTSILNRAETLYVNSAPTYDEQEVYEKNDVVFSNINNQYYYWQNDEGYSNLEPVRKNDSWSRENGYFLDQNTEYWTREFFWKPSIGLNISQEPRVKEVSLSSKYTQIYNDGINESLLNLDLSFNNRTDEEAYAILHFLESHLGYRPFLFSPPAPYETPQNFICQEWSHAYNYKNNHSIKAKFEQFPFNISAQGFDSSSTAPLPSLGQLIFESPLVFVSQSNDEDAFGKNEILRKRLNIENIGSTDITINSIYMQYDFEAYVINNQDLLDYYNDPSRNWYYDAIAEPVQSRTIAEFGESHWFKAGIDEGRSISSDGGFYIIASEENGQTYVPLVVPSSLSEADYIFDLPNIANLPFNLSQKRIKISKNIEGGVEGGFYFDEINISNQQVVESYFQRNNGKIRKESGGSYVNCDYFILEAFFAKNKTNVIPAETKGYIDIVYDGSIDLEDYLVGGNNDYIVYNGNGMGRIILTKNNEYFERKIIIDSSAPFSPQKGSLKIYLNNE